MPILGIIASSFRSAAGPEGAYDALATVTVPSGGLSSITFAGIPSGYKHLQLRMRTKTTNTLDINFRFNGDTGNNYTGHGIYGDGSQATSITPYTSVTSGYVGYSPSIHGASIIDVIDYASTSKNKTSKILHGNDNNGLGYIMLNSSAWLSTAAVTSMTVLVTAGTFEQHSQFALYGVK